MSPSSDDTVISRRQRRTTDDLLHWRRSQVVKLLAQGLTIDQAADKLQVSPKTIQRDHAYIRQNSKQVLQQYFTDTLPNEVLKTIARLTAVSDEAWEMARQAKENNNHKLRTEALRLAKDAANDISDIITNNESLIDSARAVEDREKRLSDLNPRSQDNHDYDSDVDEKVVEEEEEEEEQEVRQEEEEELVSDVEELLSENRRAERRDNDPEAIF
jgi:hypothetical protein